MKIRSVGAELFHGDRQTDRHDEGNSRFSKLCERVHRHTTKPVVIFSQILRKNQKMTIRNRRMKVEGRGQERKEKKRKKERKKGKKIEHSK